MNIGGHGGVWGGQSPLEDFAYVVNSDLRGGRYYIIPPLEPRPMPIYGHEMYPSVLAVFRVYLWCPTGCEAKLACTFMTYTY